ncbi:unnamed protein product [Sphagnum balticum]
MGDYGGYGGFPGGGMEGYQGGYPGDYDGGMGNPGFSEEQMMQQLEQLRMMDPQGYEQLMAMMQAQGR